MMSTTRPTPLLIGFFTRKTRDAVRAEDLAEQTLTLLRKHVYSTGSDVVPWAFAVARNLLRAK